MNLLKSLVTAGCLAGAVVSFADNVSEAHPDQIWVPSSEQKVYIDLIAKGIKAKIEEGFKKTGKAVRDAHAKQHGCVKAKFTVLGGLEKYDLNHGVFRTPGKTYDAWIRYSNGSGDPKQKDLVPGGRGMAIKLFGVEGKKFLTDEKYTLDFNMINHPVFFVKNAKDYAFFSKDQKAFFGTHPEEFAVIQAMSSPKINPPKNPLESRYFSMTPRQLGPKDHLHPIKFAATPVPCVDGAALPKPVELKQSDDALRIAMRETLQQRDACFEFQIQTQTNETEMPVENPVKLWDEKLSPFRSVAKIVIAKQAFESKAQEEFCEDLSISPWHTTVEHQPLGSIELTRKVVYQVTSERRHELNGRAKKEPTGAESFEQK